MSASANSKTVEIECPNGVAWGSIDPVADGAPVLYSEADAATIEAAYAGGAPSVTLSIFGGLTIVFNGGRPFQQTSTGYRSVFRCEQAAPAPVGLEVERHPRMGSWHLRQNRASHIGLLVDTSGSMSIDYRTVAEKALEEFVGRQTQEVESAHLRFYGSTFAAERRTLFDGVELKAQAHPSTTVEEIKQAFYGVQPSGSTAYYDAVVSLIDDVCARCLPEDEVVLCVVTDGGDNVSRSATLASMRTRIEQMKQRGWNIIMIGVNGYDSEAVSDAYGIGRGASLSAGRTAENIRDTFANVSASVGRVRQGHDAAVAFTATERSGARQ